MAPAAAVIGMQHFGSISVSKKTGLPLSLLHNRVLFSCKRNTGPAFSRYTSTSKARLRLQKFFISAILEKPSSSGTNSAHPSRAVLEKLYIEGPGSVIDLAVSGCGSSDLAVSALDQNFTLHDLRSKEEELRKAEREAEKESEDVHLAKSAIVKGEKNLEVATAHQKAKSEQILLLRKELTTQSKELEEAKIVVKLQQSEVLSLQDQFQKKKIKMRNLKFRLLEKDQAMLKINAEIKSRESQIIAARSVVLRQASEVDKLKSCVKRKDDELRKSEERRFLKQEKLAITESDLEKRVIAYLSAQEELSVLCNDAEIDKTRGLLVKQETEEVRLLLMDVRKELEISQKTVGKYRQEMEDKDLQYKQQREELAAQRSLLDINDLRLQEARASLEKEREQVQLLKASSEQLEHLLQEERCLVKNLQLELDKEKASMQRTVLEINSLRKELQRQESVFSDNKLSLQLKEAELVSLRLEVQGLKHDLTQMHIALEERDQELQTAKKMVEDLQMEVSRLRGLLKAEEERYNLAAVLLKEKDQQLDIMKLDLDQNKVKLSEASSVVEQIAGLSRFLAESSKDGNSSPFAEGSALVHTNYQLFSANRALLETDIDLQKLREESVQEKVKRQELETELKQLRICLQEKDTELQVIHRALVNKDVEFKQLQNKWEARERELNKMREDVIEEAKGLTSLHLLAQTPAGDLKQCPGVVAVEKLKFEVAKLDLEVAKLVLQGLSDLSFELVESEQADQFATRNPNAPRFSSLPCSSPSQFSSNLSQVATELDNLKLKLEGRDEALEHTKRAMANLSKMTREFMVEAGVKIEPFRHAYSF